MAVSNQNTPPKATRLFFRLATASGLGATNQAGAAALSTSR